MIGRPDPPREGRVETLFAEALALPNAERKRWLDAACEGDSALRHRVERLLDAHERMGDFIETPAARVTVDPEPLGGEALAPGTRVGPYEIRREVGEGGFGVVYEAHQHEPVERRVALKVLKAGMDTRDIVRRFERERRTIARMDHPHIARFFDVGATDGGRPYFVMEFVPGEPITAYCDRHRLSTRARIELFLGVCAAIQHAHQKGVIHRDLKPNNLLVTEIDGRPIPRVIDFGIAKAIDSGSGDEAAPPAITRAAQVLGTPSYMSPEQRGSSDSVDVRSDVYSLGVVLYELLTGALPYPVGADRDREPPRPSTRVRDGRAGEPPTTRSEVAAQRGETTVSLSRVLKDDLDWIILRALRPEPEGRYATVHDLARDLERQLAGLPVTARPPSHSYRFRKFVRRHRVGVAAGGAVLGSVLVSVVVLASLVVELDRQRTDATDSRSAAIAARDEAESVVDFLTQMLAEVSVHRQGPEVRVRDTLQVGERKLAELDDTQAVLRARLRHTIGVCYREIGLHTRSIAALTRALEERQSLLGEAHSDTIATRLQLAISQRMAGDLLRARETIAPLASVDSDFELPAVQIPFQSSVIERELGHFDRALELLASIDGSGGGAPRAGWESVAPEIALCRARIHFERGELDDGLDQVAIALGHLEDEPIDSARREAVQQVQASLLVRQGRLDEAEAIHQRTIDATKDDLGLDHPFVLSTRVQRAAIWAKRGRVDEALEEALAIRAAVDDELGPNALVGATVDRLLFSIHLDQDRWHEAEAALRRSIVERSEFAGDDRVSALRDENRLAMILRRTNRVPEAEALLVSLEERAVEQLGEDHDLVHMVRMNLAQAYQATRRFDLAMPRLEGAARGLERRLGRENQATLAAFTNLGILYRYAGRLDDSERVLVDNLAVKRRVIGDEAPFTRNCRRALADTFLAAEKFDAAATLLREVLPIEEKHFGLFHVRSHRTRRLLRSALEAAGRADESKAVTREEMALLRDWAAARGSDADPQHANHAARRFLMVDDEALRDSALAWTLADEACRATDGQEHGFLETRALAAARLGRFDQAVEDQRRALDLVDDPDKKAFIARRLELFEQERLP